MITDQPDCRLVGRRVEDVGGYPLGSLAGTYVDARTGVLLFGAVLMLRRGRRKLVMVSLVDATINTGSVTVTYGRDLARRGPSMRPGQELPASREAALFAHYDLPRRHGGDHRQLQPAETS